MGFVKIVWFENNLFEIELNIIYSKKLIINHPIKFIEIMELIEVCKNGDANLVTELLNKGHDPNIKCICDNLYCIDRTPLHLACCYGNLGCIKALSNTLPDRLSLTDLNIQDNYGWTPLHCAANQSSIDCVKELIKMGADLNIKDHTGRTVLHYMCREKDFIKVLMEANADINIQDKDGWTPLHIVCYHFKYDVIKEFLLYHPNMTLKDNSGLTPLELAEKFGFNEVVKILKDYEESHHVTKSAKRCNNIK